MILRLSNKNEVVDYISKRHYSPIMPRLTKHYLGCYVDNELVVGRDKTSFYSMFLTYKIIDSNKTIHSTD